MKITAQEKQLILKRRSKVKAEIFSKENLDDLITKVQEMTDTNDHNEARLEVAKFIKSKIFTTIFTKIKDIQKVLNNMPHSLLVFRKEMTNNMLMEIGKKYGNEVKDKIYQSM